MKHFKIIILLFFAAAFHACSGPDTDDTPQPQEQEVSEMTVTIDHIVNGQALQFITSTYTLPAGTEVKPTRLAYLLSNFYLVKTDESKVMLDDQFALIDVKNGVLDFTLENVPMGDYKAIGLSLGLDSSVNHGDPNQYDVDHPLSSVNNALHWNWTSGYIFIGIEGRLASNNDSYVYHVAGDRNRIDYELPFAFTKNRAALNASLNFDYEEIFKAPNLFDMETDGMSIHSISGPVTEALVQNMADVFTVTEIK